MEMLTGMSGFVVGGVAAIILFMMTVITMTALIRVCPPNMVMVVTGTQTEVAGKAYGFRIQKGGWTLVIPYFQQAQLLDLSIIPIAVRLEGVNSANGITMGADATACVCVCDENEPLLYSAVERLMGKSRKEIQEQIQQTMVGNFRGALNKTTPLEAIGMVESVEMLDGDQSPTVPAVRSEAREGERAQFRHELLRDSNEDLSAFGMQVVSVSLQKIWDTSNYIANLATKSLSRKRQDIEVQEARLHARAESAESDSERRCEVVRSQADERIVKAREELEVARRQCTAEVEQVRLEAEGAIARAENEGERKVQQTMIELQKLRNVSEVTLRAEAEQRAAEILAEGERTAVNLFEQTRNDLLQQKTEIVARGGDAGRIALLVQQQLPALFASYAEHAKQVQLDNLIVMEDEHALDRVVNRGPLAMVEFLKHFQRGFGIDIHRLLQTAPQDPPPETS